MATHTDGYMLEVGDINGDGYSDIFFPHSNDIDIWLNDGNGNFYNNGQQDFDINSCEDATLADFDNDGDLDAAVVRGGGSGFVGKVFWNDGTGQFTDSGQELTHGNAEGIDAGDIDNDGDIDLVAAEWSGRVIIYKNDGLGNFYTGADDTIGPSTFYNDIILKDINFDGLVDIVTDVHVWLNNPDTPGVFILQQFSLSGSTHDIDMGDINNDGLYDIYMGRFSSSDGDKVYLANQQVMLDTNITLCYGDSILIAGEWITSPGTYFNYHACDTLEQIHLNFYPQVDMSVTLTGTTLTVAEDNATYQWLDCNNGYDTIPGATQQSFTPSQSGNYAVAVSKYNCTYISDCYEVNITKNDVANLNTVNIYPNPTRGIINIQMPNKAKIKITNITGQIIIEKDVNKKAIIDLTNYNAGIYFITIKTDNQVVVRKIIKN